MKGHSEVLTKEISRNNFRSFIWHAIFLSIAVSFMDIDTIIPDMLLKAGGKAWQIGLLSSIAFGFARFSQLFFAPIIAGYKHKKKFLLLGVNIRIFTLILLSLTFYLFFSISNNYIIPLIFILVSIFSISGGLANIPYTEIMGKSIIKEDRKQILSLKQFISSIGMFGSAFLVIYIIKSYKLPTNYSIVFILASLFLFIASLGFWKLTEVIPKKTIVTKNNFKKIWTELKGNKKLQHYLLIVNILGIGRNILPFILLFHQHNFSINTNIVGGLLFAKTIGLIISGLIMYFYSKKISYNTMLIIMTILSGLIIIPLWVFNNLLIMYYFSFFCGGLFLTLYAISNNGILLEISNTNNRAILTGIAGAGNILPIIFPIIGGIIITKLNFDLFFILFLIISLVGIWYIRAFNCTK